MVSRASRALRASTELKASWSSRELRTSTASRASRTSVASRVSNASMESSASKTSRASRISRASRESRASRATSALIIQKVLDCNLDYAPVLPLQRQWSLCELRLCQGKEALYQLLTRQEGTMFKHKHGRSAVSTTTEPASWTCVGSRRSYEWG